MKLEHLGWLVISFFALAATSIPSKRSQKLENVRNLVRQSEKKRFMTENVSNRRSSYPSNSNDEDEEEREAQLESEELFEEKSVKRRGNDKYGPRRSYSELEAFIGVVVAELIKLEANITEQVDRKIMERVSAVQEMAITYKLVNPAAIKSKRDFEELAEKTDRLEEDDALEEEMGTKRKREETEQEEERMDSREATETIIERQTNPLNVLGTVLYKSSYNTSLGHCLDSCRMDTNCDSILLIVNSYLCILHQDL